MNVLSFTIPGPPFGKPTVARDQYGRAYRPTETTRFYATVSWLIGAKCQRKMIAPSVAVIAVKKRPKRKPANHPFPWDGRRSPCRAKPDADNILKALLDALKNAKVYGDDAHVISVYCATVYAAEGEEPHTAVVVQECAGAAHPTRGLNPAPNRSKEVELDAIIPF